MTPLAARVFLLSCSLFAAGCNCSPPVPATDGGVSEVGGGGGGGEGVGGGGGGGVTEQALAKPSPVLPAAAGKVKGSTLEMDVVVGTPLPATPTSAGALRLEENSPIKP